MCACSYRSAIDVKVDTQGCVLGKDVADLRFELGTGSQKQCGGSGTGPGCVAHAQLLKLQKSGRPKKRSTNRFFAAALLFTPSSMTLL